MQGMKVEKGCGHTSDHSRTCPADILALDWDRGMHAVFDVLSHPLCLQPFFQRQACLWGPGALEAEVRKQRK